MPAPVGREARLTTDPTAVRGDLRPPATDPAPVWSELRASADPSAIGGELRLPTDRFVRISRFYIVQIDRIKELELFDSGDCRVTLHTGTKLTLSRRYRANFKTRGLL